MTGKLGVGSGSVTVIAPGPGQNRDSYGQSGPSLDVAVGGLDGSGNGAAGGREIAVVGGNVRIPVAGEEVGDEDWMGNENVSVTRLGNGEAEFGDPEVVLGKKVEQLVVDEDADDESAGDGLPKLVPFPGVSKG